VVIAPLKIPTDKLRIQPRIAGSSSPPAPCLSSAACSSHRPLLADRISLHGTDSRRPHSNSTTSVKGKRLRTSPPATQVSTRLHPTDLLLHPGGCLLSPSVWPPPGRVYLLLFFGYQGLAKGTPAAYRGNTEAIRRTRIGQVAEWQTHPTQNRAGKPVWVRLPPWPLQVISLLDTAPQKSLTQNGFSPPQFQTPFGITACESITQTEYHTIDNVFQTPFGITACESVQNPARMLFLNLFQTPFGITACESNRKENDNGQHDQVSNAFRHHCM
jgi:hypothetical protein